MATNNQKHVQILATQNPHIVQVHDLSKTQYNSLKKEVGRTAGKRNGFLYVGISDYLAQMDVPEVLERYIVIANPNSYQVVEVD